MKLLNFPRLEYKWDNANKRWKATVNYRGTAHIVLPGHNEVTKSIKPNGIYSSQCTPFTNGKGFVALSANRIADIRHTEVSITPTSRSVKVCWDKEVRTFNPQNQPSNTFHTLVMEELAFLSNSAHKKVSNDLRNAVDRINPDTKTITCHESKNVYIFTCDFKRGTIECHNKKGRFLYEFDITGESPLFLIRNMCYENKNQIRVQRLVNELRAHWNMKPYVRVTKRQVRREPTVQWQIPLEEI